MLPQPSSGFRPQHRRQNSTPITNQATWKMEQAPPTQNRRGGHRRGLSLDPRQVFPHSMVSTNQGGPIQQHETQVAQQQRLSGPGQYQQPNLYHTQQHYSLSNITQPLQNIFEHNDTEKVLEQELVEFINCNNAFKPTCIDPSITEDASPDFDFDFDYESWKTQAGESNPIVQGIYNLDQSLTQSTSFDNNALQRSCTPPNEKINDSIFSLTNERKSVQHGSRTAQSSPTRRRQKATKTPKAISTAMKRGSSCQDSSQTIGKWNGSPILGPTPNTAGLPYPTAFDMATIPPPNFLDLSTLRDLDFSSTSYNPSNYSPVSNQISPTMSSLHSSPELTHMSLFPVLGESVPKLPQPMVQNALAELSKTNPVEASQLSNPAGCFQSDISQQFTGIEPLGRDGYKSRSQSVTFNDSAQLLDGTVKETGVTNEEIASYIQSPDPDNTTDSRYHCLWPECGRKFGRKENIKSHVQTHLGDRQFLCNHCDGAFVRQHDLKRHLKIHSGVKDYPCLCGMVFNRQDALTRHKLRELPGCDGKPVDPNSPQKESKRGRPRKSTRPGMEERRAKANKTRKRVQEKSAGSPESFYSDCSHPSPEQFLDDFDMDLATYSFQASQPMSLAPYGNPLSLTPPASPGPDNRPTSPIMPEFINFNEVDDFLSSASQSPESSDDWDLPSLSQNTNGTMYSFDENFNGSLDKYEMPAWSGGINDDCDPLFQ